MSVVICTYNGAKYLEEQLLSIVAQTYTNLEIIIQDDGSSDDTLEVAAAVAKNDSRISIYRNETNLGIIQNFYDVLRKAKGKYIAISDQDDIWLPHKIATLVSKIGDASLIYSDSILIDSHGKRLGTTLLQKLKRRPISGRDITRFFRGNTVSGHACMIDSKLTTLVDEFRYAIIGPLFMYDQMLATLASFQNGVCYCSEALTEHRVHSGNNHNGGGLKRKPSSQAQRSVSYFKRKDRRVSQKISTQEDCLQFFHHLLVQHRGIDTQVTRTKAHCLFDLRLYINLTKDCGLAPCEAFHISKGKLFFQLFRFF